MSAEESAAEEWDFLLSYTALDDDWAEWLAWQLESAGYRVLIRAWDCVPGSNWTTHVQVGIVGAKRILLVLSPAYLRSLADEPEWQAAVAANPSGSERRLLPVRVQACEPVGLLARLTAIDLVGATREAAGATLLRLVRHALDGRAKPPCEPAYPVRRSPGRDEPDFPAVARGPAHGPGDAPGYSPTRARTSPAAAPPGVDAARTLRPAGRPDQLAARLSAERAPSARRRGKSDPGDPRRLAAAPRAIRPREP
ncbi:TIR domain-containing protein, partial [Frankia sp. AgKG'84/4]|uniref:TIR domain-containing protein n=1 Tax=Frankia sp. AgKG'84/4 TaxID=573490 RepID=UPI00202A922E